LDPAALLKEIRTNGAQQVATKLKDTEWPSLVQGVETGADPWLRVAVALHPATDAGLSESLVLAAGVALAWAPKEVLILGARELSVTGICGYPDMSDPRTDSQDKVVAYLNVRIDAVTKVSDAKAAPLRSACLSELNKTKADVTRPDGPFSR
jgi:hypothetical protein